MDPITISMLEMGLSLTGMVFKLLRHTGLH